RISLRLNPILVILSLLLGFQLYGIAGALVALPVVAVIRETTAYLRRHMVLEPGGPPAPAGASPPPTPQPPSGPPEPAGSADRVRPPVSEHAADEPVRNSDDPHELHEAAE